MRVYLGVVVGHHERLSCRTGSDHAVALAKDKYKEIQYHTGVTVELILLSRRLSHSTHLRICHQDRATFLE